ncbi:MAG: hypothetical protein JJU12_05415 [Chlamydiales bacterium]|nr:hypothetical protein [Chlamydiales bacterium]
MLPLLSGQQTLDNIILFEPEKRECIEKIIVSKIDEKVYLFALTSIKKSNINKIYCLREDTIRLSATFPQTKELIQDIAINNKELYALRQGGITIFSLKIDQDNIQSELILTQDTHYPHSGGTGLCVVNKKLIGLINCPKYNNGRLPIPHEKGEITIMRSPENPVDFRLSDSKIGKGVAVNPSSITHCSNTFFISVSFVSYSARASLGSVIYQIDEDNNLLKLLETHANDYSRLSPISDSSFVSWGHKGFKIIDKGEVSEGYKASMSALSVQESKIFIFKKKKFLFKQVGDSEFKKLNCDQIRNATRRLSKFLTGQTVLLKGFEVSGSQLYILDGNKVFSFNRED